MATRSTSPEHSLHMSQSPLLAGFVLSAVRTYPAVVRGAVGTAMDLGRQKEEFQYAYVAALAAQAGLNRGDFRVDDDSVDVTFQGRGYAHAQFRSPQVQFQLKCSSQSLISEGVVKYPLSKKNYDELRGTNVLVPRYLAVLVVPDETEKWVVHNGDCVSLYNLCFWHSLRHAPASTNSKSVTVQIPVSQRLTTDVLTQMMAAASMGDAI